MPVVAYRANYSAGITAPSGWDATYRAALADVATTPVRVAFLGDSFVQGQYADDFNGDGYAALVRDSLTTRYGYGGDGRIPADSVRFIAGYLGSPPFVVAAGPTWINGRGLSQVPVWSSGAPSPAITFTTEYACTDIDLLYSHHTAGTWTYTVDGGAPVTVTTVGSNYVAKIQLTGLANTTHTIVCSGDSANAALQLAMIATYKTRTSGVQVARAGVSAQQLGAWTTNVLTAWGGANQAGTWGQLGTPSAPHLAVLAFGLNDCAYQSFTSVDSDAFATFRYRLQQLIGALRRANNASIVLVCNANPDGVTSDALAYFDNEDSWPRYREIMHTTAAAHRCAILDLHDRWRDVAWTSGYTTQTNAHPTTAGHADIADALLELV